MQESRVLEALLRNAGMTVPKQKLASLLWPDAQHGDFDRAINNIVSRLRRTLGEDGREGRSIQTVPKSGYRLLCAVTTDFEKPNATFNGGSPEPTTTFEIVDIPTPVSMMYPEEGTSNATDAAHPATDKPARHVYHRWVLHSILGALIGVGSVFLLMKRSPSQPPTTIRVVGILPLEVSGTELPSAGEMVRGELADAIAQIPNVQVRAAHSLTLVMGQNDEALRKTARLLALDLLVVGSVNLTADRYDLNLELIRGVDGAHLSSFHYAGPRIGLPEAATSLSRDLFRFIGKPGSIDTSPQTAQGSTQDVNAYNLYFQASQALTERSKSSIQSAIMSFEKAVGLDPRFSKAYSGLAESYLVAADFGAGANVQADFERTRTAANAAIHLNPADARAHSVLGLLLLQHDWKLVDAENELRTAVQLNPGLAANHMRLAVLLADRKDFEHARGEIALAHQLDPLWPVVYGTSLYVNIMGRRYPEAIRDGHSLVNMRPVWGRAHEQLGWALWYSGAHAQAVEEWRQSAVLDHDADREKLEARGLRLIEEEGVVAYAHAKLRALESGGPNGDFVPAEWHAFAGDRTETLAGLTVMVDQRDPESLKIPINPAYDFLRSDPQYQLLIERIGFSELRSPDRRHP